MIYIANPKQEGAVTEFLNIETQKSARLVGDHYEVRWSDGSSANVPVDSPQGRLIAGLIILTAETPKLAVSVVQPVIERITQAMDKRAAKALLSNLQKVIGKK